MKKITSIVIILSTILTLITPITVSAEDVTTVVADESWTNAIYDSTTGLLSNIDDGYSFIWEPSSGTIKFGGTVITSEKVVIPSSINGVAVVKTGSYIMNGARNTSSSVKEVIVSKGITELGKAAFQSESKLQKITLPDGLKTIGSSAINSCTSLTQINIPDSVEKIDSNALASCTILESIVLPNNLTTLGTQAFSNCKKLSTVVFNGNKLTTLKSKTFNLCPIANIVLPDSITTLESGVFTSNKITEITIPSGVNAIPSQLFASCTNLKTIIIKGSVSSIGEKAFYNLKNLEMIKFEGDVAPASIDSTAFDSAKTGFTVSYPSRGAGYNSSFRALFDGLNVTFTTVSGTPEATGVSVKGDTMLGNTLTGYYTEYYDVNGDEEDGSTYSWKRSKDPMFVQNIELITTGSIKAGDTVQYTLTNEDVGYYIQFSVIPRNKAEFDSEGEEIGATTEFVVREPKTVPTVTLLSPVNGEAIGATEIASFLVDVTCDLTTITKVEYYANSTLVYTSTEEPYSGEWATHPIGYYEVYARAYNALGEFADSEKITVTVAESDPITMTSLFGNDMVLQRRKPVAIYGNAEDSEKTITVKFNGQEKTGEIKGGKFRIMLDSMEAGGPYTLEIIAGRSGFVKTFTNVMVGEVWVCSGQSNMAVNGGSSASRNYPNIRFFKQSSSSASYEMDDVKDGSWNVCTKEFSARYSAVSVYFSEKLHNDLNVPVGILLGAISDTRMVRWIPYDAIAADADVAVYAKGQSSDSTLYNGMIAPFTPFTISGFVWYQGEGDHLYGHVFEKNFTSIVKSWRKAWGDESLPFLFVQLPNFDYNDKSTIEFVREAQLNAYKNLPNMGMAVTLDIGNNNNIHPGNKDITAYRLALHAEKFLGELKEDTVYSSPIYNSYEIKGDKIIITFDHVGTGLKTKDGSDPLAFTICGDDKVFVEAQAKIISYNQIEVWSDTITNPIAVRYAWLDIPVINLVNSADLPASPFRTDRFKELTNVAPIVELTSPNATDSFKVGDTVTLTANVYDPNGEVSSVSFYVNGEMLGTDTTAPYSYTITDAKEGVYAFSVSATDDDGATNLQSGSVTATIQPYQTVVGNLTAYTAISHTDDNFEDYVYNTDGDTPPESLKNKVALDGARIFSVNAPQTSGKKAMVITTNAAAQSPIISDDTHSGTVYKINTKVLFDSYNADRTFVVNINNSAIQKEILRFCSDGTISISQPYAKIVDSYDLNKWYDVNIEFNTLTNRINISVNDKIYVDNKVIKGFNNISGINIQHTSITDEEVSTYFDSLTYGAYAPSFDTPVTFSPVIYSCNNKQINNLENGLITATTSVESYTGNPKTAVMIIAAYEGNKLLDLFIGESVTIAQNSTPDLEVSLDITSLKTADKVKTFIFNNTNDIEPMAILNQLNKN